MRELRLNVSVGIYPRINRSGFLHVDQRFSRYGQFFTKVPYKYFKLIGLFLGCDIPSSSGTNDDKLESWFLGFQNGYIVHTGPMSVTKNVKFRI